MLAFKTSMRRNRFLTAATVLTAALALVAMSQTRPARAQTPGPTVTPTPTSSGCWLCFYRPELHVASAEVRYLGAPYVTPGYYLLFVVENTGNADAGAFTVEVRPLNYDYAVQSFAVSGIKAGAGKGFWHRLPDPPACGYAWSDRAIFVDSTKAVSEWNEDNNVTVANYQYGPGWDPCIK